MQNHGLMRNCCYHICLCIYYFLLIWQGWGQERLTQREKETLKHRFAVPLMHSLVHFCMCPDWDWTHNPGILGWRSNQLSYPVRVLLPLLILHHILALLPWLYWSGTCCHLQCPFCVDSTQQFQWIFKSGLVSHPPPSPAKRMFSAGRRFPPRSDVNQHLMLIKCGDVTGGTQVTWLCPTCEESWRGKFLDFLLNLS